jgi:probable HAF family extracellular repeat protein
MCAPANGMTVMRRLTRGVVVTSGLLAVTLAGAGVAPAAGSAPPLRVARVHDLGTLGGPDSRGEQINDRGQVLGSSTTAEGTTAPFFWDGARLHRVAAPGWARVTAAALNDRGQVAGTLSDASGRTSAFLWRRGHVRELGTLGHAAGATSTAADVNDAGHVVGTSTRGAGRPERAFLWRDGRMTDLGTLGGASSRAVAVNNRDQVIGESETADGRMAPFLWSGGRMRELESLPQPSSNVTTAINDRGVVLGLRQSSEPNADMEAVLWTRTGVVRVGLFLPVALNDRGDVVGHDVFDFRALRWRNGVLSELPGLGGASAALAVNSRGVAAGATHTPEFVERAVVWDVDGAMLDLGTLGGGEARADGINDRHQVVGTASLPDGTQHAAVWDLRR